MKPLTLIYSRQGRRGQYWLLQPDNDMYGEAFLFENQFDQKRFAGLAAFFDWLRSMPIGCIVKPPAGISMTTRVNSRGYTRVARLKCENKLPKIRFRPNIRKKQRGCIFRKTGWQVKRDWYIDLEDAVQRALQLDSYALAE